MFDTLSGPGTLNRDWIALSDHAAGCVKGGDAGLISAGLFVIELAMPLPGGTVLLDYRSNDGWPRGFSVAHDLAAGLVLTHRQGNTVVRHLLAGPFRAREGRALLSFQFDAPARRWEMKLETLAAETTPTTAALANSGSNPLPFRTDDMLAMCREDSGLLRHPSVLWFGFSRGGELPKAAPWIGCGTPVQTRRGLIAAGRLLPGDEVATQDDGMLPLLALHRFEVPNSGSFVSVLLRPPYFCASHVLAVSPDQMIVLSGIDVEYLFGEDEVLVSADHLVDEQTALKDPRQPTVQGVALDFGAPTLFAVDGCVLVSASAPEVSKMVKAPRRKLMGYEVLTLMSHMGRTARHCSH